MKRSELRQIIREEIKENMGLETRNKTAQKLIKEYGWEIAILMDELSKKKFGLNSDFFILLVFPFVLIFPIM